ncbi:NAD(P)H-dependent oxidoreductase [[Clostridium] innocuum]|nr:NAD(P)H-dependent oxidoreductase [[Clostridium] innocuum]
MKKAFSILMVLTLLFSLAACSNSTTNEGSSSPTQQSSDQSSTPAEESNSQNDSSQPIEESNNPSNSSASTETGSKSLVVYFSWSGNTENVAKSIQSQTDSDIFEIVPATPYSDDYEAVVDLAQEEQRNDARPAISGSIENIEQYDVVYVGFPNWWGDMPMILYTFFDTYDLSGRSVAMFCTSGGSGLSGTVNEVKSLEPDATVTEGLHISSGSSSNPDNAVSEWLNNIGLAK